MSAFDLTPNEWNSSIDGSYWRGSMDEELGQPHVIISFQERAFKKNKLKIPYPSKNQGP